MWGYIKGLLVTLWLSIPAIYDQCNVASVRRNLELVLSQQGEYKVYPMKVGDYNREVLSNYGEDKGLKMTLSYSDDTIAFVVIHRNEQKELGNAREVLKKALAKYSKMYEASECGDADSLQLVTNDLDYWTKLPAVHLQSAAHASGAAFYYQRKHVGNEPDSWSGKSIFGVSRNAEYGEATMVTGVIIAEELKDSTYQPEEPEDVVASEEQRIKLLSDENFIQN